MSQSDVITAVRDPNRVLGKRFTLKSDGTVNKDSAVQTPIAIAVQHEAPNIHALEKILIDVGVDSHAAVINSAFPAIPVGEEFLILSEKELFKRGINRHDTSLTWPVEIEYAGQKWLALGRFKEHTQPSSWILLDRDVDNHTPECYAKLSYEEWLAEVDKLIPGVLNCARLHAYSSSSRVSIDGTPIAAGNGHTWLQVGNPEDINRLRTAVKARAIALGMAWTKPRRSRSTGQIVGQDVVSIVDWSVFTTGRLVFVGKPEVDNAI